VGGVPCVRATLAQSYHNSKRATLYGLSVPSTRQSTEQEDSTAISALTREIYNDNTYFNPLRGKEGYKRFVQVEGSCWLSELRSNAKSKGLLDSSET